MPGFLSWIGVRKQNNARFPGGFRPIDEYQEQDIFIVGYPKSGNTWVQNLIAGATHGVDLQVTPDSLVQELVPDVHYKTFYKRFGTQVFFKSHSLPRADYRRVIYLIRDGRDVMVSYLHHLRAVQTEPVDFLNLVRDGRGFTPCKWHEHVGQWMANPYASQMIIVRYEDLKKDAASQLQRMCEFAGLRLEAGRLQEVARQASFALMQQRERRLGWDNSAWPRNEPFVRRGVVGSHVDEMPAEVQEAFLVEAAAALKNAGYSVDVVPPKNCENHHNQGVPTHNLPRRTE